ncbi:hypothetical protein [Maricaulis sp.]|uniref:hypothetical protein n=1 Tax=unclassified Maricaulis TaxID=2632371 RepID=UPI001B20FBFE|nr:hypothetical protein [Maricaulis sp.]MBO6796591.1 hypothetical protein [Maricaulis sp.]
MTMIRSLVTVPTPTSRRVPPVGKASGSNDRPSQPQNALVPVPTQRESEPRAKTSLRARNAAAEVVVQVIAGNPRRGIRAEASEQARYRRAYANAAATPAPRPRWEKCA